MISSMVTTKIPNKMVWTLRAKSTAFLLMHAYLRGVRLRPAVLHYIQNALLLEPERPVNENETLLKRYSNKMY